MTKAATCSNKQHDINIAHNTDRQKSSTVLKVTASTMLSCQFLDSCLPLGKEKDIAQVLCRGCCSRPSAAAALPTSAAPSSTLLSVTFCFSSALFSSFLEVLGEGCAGLAGCADGAVEATVAPSWTGGGAVLVVAEDVAGE